MTTVLLIADAFRRALVPFLIGAAAVFVALLALLVVQRSIRSLIGARHARVTSRLQPLVLRVLEGAASDTDSQQLGAAARRSPLVVGRLLIAPLAALVGTPVARAAAFARTAGLDQWWLRQAGQRSWWRRADAIRALGLIEHHGAMDAVTAALDDSHEEVRAAAVAALGRLRDPRAAGVLLARLPDESRHQRVRVIDALQQIGAPAAEPLLAVLRAHPTLLAFSADLVATVCGSLALDDLLQWTSHEAPAVRAGALQALARIGVADVSYYHALKCLSDDDAHVRAMAARALGRARRDEAAPYLAARLDDDWTVAAESARALRSLPGAGRALLGQKSAGQGQGADLARQALWEMDHRRRPGAPESA